MIQAPGATRSKLTQRLLLLVALLAIENTLVAEVKHPWFYIFLYRGMPIVFGLALLFFGRARLRALPPLHLAFNASAAIVHGIGVLLFTLTEIYLVRFYGQGGDHHLQIATWIWVALLPLLVSTLVVALFPVRTLTAVARALGAAWAYAAGCSVIVILLREFFRRAWDAPWDGFSAKVGNFVLTTCFHQASALLHLFYPEVIALDADQILGTKNFQVHIAGSCSGTEGLVLILVLMSAWIIFARRELRIGRALLLLPLGAALMWSLNLIRIVALIAIGDAGYPDVSVHGFHTEAGWIAFNLVSLALMASAQRIAWFRRSSPVQPAKHTAYTRNLAAIYLAPFLAITAASVIATAVSSGFEWLYPLRFVAAVAVLWAYRREYRAMNWSFGWLGIAAGLAVAALWLGCAVLLPHTEADKAGAMLAARLAMLSAPARFGWIAIRTLAAVITVPMAEELAFRGYIARRLVSADLEAVPYAKLTLLPILGSSLAFGAMHGRLWPAGVVAGIIFALVAKRTNRLGEAFAAHATANLALALIVLVRGDYSLW